MLHKSLTPRIMSLIKEESTIPLNQRARWYSQNGITDYQLRGYKALKTQCERREGKASNSTNLHPIFTKPAPAMEIAPKTVSKNSENWSRREMLMQVEHLHKKAKSYRELEEGCIRAASELLAKLAISFAKSA